MAGSPFLSARAIPGTKSVALQDLPESAWRSIVGTPLDESLSPAEVYTRVPWVYRAVQLRAHTLADIPIAVLARGTEVWSSEDDETPPPKNLAWLTDIFDLLYRTEMALCIDARAYWLIKRNRARILEMQWLQPTSITPKFDAKVGLTGFERKLGTQILPLDVTDVFHVWHPSHVAELGPGISPVRAVIQAAGLLKGIDDFGRGFFDRGAINTTILQVATNANPEDLARLEKWWKRLVSGVRRAFETIAVRADTVTPIVVGSPPKDMALETLTAAKRLDVAAGLGVPASLIEDQAANYATARESTWSFLNFTVLPAAEMIERALNQQVFGPLGYEFRFKPEKLEIMMERRTDAAMKSLLPAAIEGYVTGNEIRLNLGLEPIDGLDNLRIAAPVQLGPSGEVLEFPNGTGSDQGQPVADEDAQLANSKSVPVKASPAPSRRTVKRVQRDEHGRILAVIEDTAA